MTYHHLWHRVYLSLSCSQALVLLRTLNDQLLLWRFISPSLHCQQLWKDISELDPKEKWAASISDGENPSDRVCISPHRLTHPPFSDYSVGLKAVDSHTDGGHGPSYTQLCCLGELKTLTHTHTKISDPTLSTCSDTGLTKGKQKICIPQVLQCGQGLSTPCVGQL